MVLSALVKHDVCTAGDDEGDDREDNDLNADDCEDENGDESHYHDDYVDDDDDHNVDGDDLWIKSENPSPGEFFCKNFLPSINPA